VTPRRRGKFITIEGLDGCGKSTQLEKLAKFLEKEGLEVIRTRQPGGTATGQKLRDILLNSRTKGLEPHAELALMFADRAQHLGEQILPALHEGKWVLCDRFTDSSEAYQGFGRELGSDTVRAMHRLVCGNVHPDLTILMISDPARSVARARRRNQQSKTRRSAQDENRFEQESRAFFGRVLDGYLEIARRDADRVVKIDAARPISAVHRDIVDAVRERMLHPHASK
jgi:dTMP kinase